MVAGLLRRFAFVSLLLLLIPAAPGQVLLKQAGGNFQPLRTKRLQAETVIAKGLAATTLTLTFENTADRRIEADFVYTVRPGTVVTGFAYWFGNEKVIARVVEKERASDIYQAITRPNRDPALIELIGKRTFRARIFPIMPKADLKVEMLLVQPLENGKTFVLPTKMPKGEQLQSIDVKVHLAEDEWLTVKSSLPLNRKDGSYVLHAESFRPQEDLRITLERARPKISDSFYAARSGGADGFFAFLASKPAGVKRAAVQISGAKTYDVHPSALTSSQPVLVTGRYKGSGKGVLRIGGQLLGEVILGSDLQPNNPASKLWAAAKIDSLGGNESVRDQVVALSTRYTIPSKFTSWLAIPKAEREAFERTIKFSRLQQVARVFSIEVAAGREKSVRALTLRRRLEMLSKEMKVNAKEVVASHLSEKWDAEMDKLSEEYAQFRFNSRVALAAKRSLQRLSPWTQPFEEVYGYPIERKLSVLADAIVNAKLNGDKGQERDAQAKYNLLSRMSRLKEPYHYTNSVRQSMQALAEKVVRARLAENKAAEVEPLAKLQMLGKSAKLDPNPFIGSVLSNKINEAAYRLGYGVDRTAPPDREKRLQELDRLLTMAGITRERALQHLLINHLQHFSTKDRDVMPHQRSGEVIAEAQKLEQELALPAGNMVKHANRMIAESAASDAARKLAEEIALGREGWIEARSIRITLEAEAAKAGRKPDDLLQSHLWQHYYKAVGAFQTAAAEHGPDSTEADSAYRVLQRLAPYGQKIERIPLLTQKLYSLAYELHQLRSEANLDEVKIALAEERLRRLSPGASQEGRTGVKSILSQGYGEAGDARQRLLAELRKPSPDQARVDALSKELAGVSWRGSDSVYHQSRIERLKAEVMLDRLEETPVTPEVRAEVERYTRVRDEMRARMGDPLVFSVAPRDARLVVALMPTGEVKRLEWIELTKRWEARFDIPASASEGPYVVQIVAVLADGTRVTDTMRYTVDNTAPTGVAVVREGFVEVSASPDTARIETVVSGQVVPLVKIREGAFRLEVGMLRGELTLWLTDKAHNRSSIKVKIG